MWIEDVSHRVCFFAWTKLPSTPRVRRPYSHWSETTLCTLELLMSRNIQGSCQDRAPDGCSRRTCRPDLSCSSYNRITKCKWRRPSESMASIFSGDIFFMFKCCHELNAVHGGPQLINRDCLFRRGRMRLSGEKAWSNPSTCRRASGF